MGKFFDTQGHVIVRSGPKKEFLQDFMPVLVICKFVEDLIKTEDTMVSKIFFPMLKVGNSEVNGWMWPELKLVQDCIAVLVTCKFDDDMINQRPEIELVRAFMPDLVPSNFDDDLIKNEFASMETPFSHYKSMGNFLDLKGS